MIKSELIKKLSKRFPNLYLKDMEFLVHIIQEEIINALKEQRRIELRGFGAFTVRKRKPRVARNPKTNEKVELGERYTPYFRAGKDLRDKINKST